MSFLRNLVCPHFSGMRSEAHKKQESILAQCANAQGHTPQTKSATVGHPSEQLEDVIERGGSEMEEDAGQLLGSIIASFCPVVVPPFLAKAGCTIKH